MTKNKTTVIAVLGALLLFTGVRTNFGLGAQPAYGKLRILIDMLDHIQNNYVEDIDTQDLIYGAASGMTQILDPFSQFLPPRALKEMKVETEGEFGGIGIRVAIAEDGWLTVITPLPGTPAFEAGVWPNDKIIKIDGADTSSITLEQAVKKLRGKPKSKVIITVSRKLDSPTQDAKTPEKEPKYEVIEVPLIRDIIKIETIYSNMIQASKIGYVRITE
ncbi:MAG: PDZ domain-containing protein, partial [Elusimicrobiota bacterium]